MNRHVTTGVIVGLAVLAIAGPAFAFPIAPPGTECLRLVVASTNPIIATYEGNSAAYSNDLYLVLNDIGVPENDGNVSNDLFIFNNHSSPVGSTMNIGSYPVGTELTFRLHVNNTGYDYYSGGAALNPDGHCHARAQADWSPGIALVSFEDLFNGPFGYNDLSFSFTNTVSTSITLAPPIASTPVGTSHTVTATVGTSAGPIVGTTVTFSIVSGPNAGAAGTCAADPSCATDAAGTVSFTYPGSGGAGTDSIEACFTEFGGTQKCSQSVTKIWTPPGCPDGQPCDDGDLCTTADTCSASTCHGTAVVCTPLDQCHLAGICDAATGACSNPQSLDGAACNDGDACTQTDACQAGSCLPGEPIDCPTSGECLVAGSCDATTGVCSDPVPVENGTPCGSNGDCWDGVCNFPPSCSAAGPSTSSLWPPNHEYVGVTVVGVTDPDSDPLTIRMTGIEQDEPLAGGGSGNACPDALGIGSATASLRAERTGQGDGRVYHVSFAADDGRGGSCAGEFTVCVPHDQSPLAGCIDGGATFNSTGPCTGLSRRDTPQDPTPRVKSPKSDLPKL